MSRSPALIVICALAGCASEEPEDCTGYDEVFAYVDADGDGFGADEPIGWRCELGANQATNNVDCDDTRADVHPSAEEICDGADNNCDDRIDETHARYPWYDDLDADGYGAPASEQISCQAPGPQWVTAGGDCDDANPAIHPGAIEACNNVDDDCDGLTDDDDPGVDPNSFNTWFRDVDDDGYGNPQAPARSCRRPNASYTSFSGDCDDNNGSVSPDGLELCNGIDDDCDSLIDDEDDTIDASDQVRWHADVDADGYGDSDSFVRACDPSGVFVVRNADDCDDDDPAVNVDRWWYSDLDGDGFGLAQTTFQCDDPLDGSVSGELGLDCDDSDDTTFPGAPDPFGDGLDTSCSGFDGTGFLDSFDALVPSDLWEAIFGDAGLTSSYSVTTNALNLGGGGGTARTVAMDMSACAEIELSVRVKRGPEQPDSGDWLDLDFDSGSGWTRIHRISGGQTDQHFRSYDSFISDPAALWSGFRLRLSSGGSGTGTDDFYVDNLAILCR